MSWIRIHIAVQDFEGSICATPGQGLLEMKGFVNERQGKEKEQRPREGR